MISLQLYKKILDSGLLLDHYLVLCNIRDGKEMSTSKRVGGFINLLNKKGYIEDGNLTEKAYEIIDIHPVMVVEENLIETAKFDFANWFLDVHKKCQDKIVELTGKRQITSKIKKTDRKGYPFLCNATDLGKKLLTAINTYKLKDMDLIESTLLRHIENCHSGNDWFPIMKYYILKEGQSSMVTEMDNLVEVSDNKSVQKFV